MESFSRARAPAPHMCGRVGRRRPLSAATFTLLFQIYLYFVVCANYILAIERPLMLDESSSVLPSDTYLYRKGIRRIAVDGLFGEYTYDLTARVYKDLSSPKFLLL